MRFDASADKPDLQPLRTFKIPVHDARARNKTGSTVLQIEFRLKPRQYVLEMSTSDVIRRLKAIVNIDDAMVGEV